MDPLIWQWVSSKWFQHFKITLFIRKSLPIENVQIKVAFDLKGTDKDGHTYASLDHIKMDMEPEHLQIKFENLFNGNQALSDSTNVFLNENWKIIYSEMKANIVKPVGQVMRTAINSFLEKRPYAEFFLWVVDDAQCGTNVEK